MVTAASMRILLWRNTTAIRNTKNISASTIHTVSANAPMETSALMLTVKSKFYQHSSIIMLKMKISTCFTIRLNSVLST